MAGIGGKCGKFVSSNINHFARKFTPSLASSRVEAPGEGRLLTLYIKTMSEDLLVGNITL